MGMMERHGNITYAARIGAPIKRVEDQGRGALAMAGTLLFYDPLAGQGTFYQFDSLGGVTPVRTHSSWRSD
jgi:hypothetical protein